MLSDPEKRRIYGAGGQEAVNGAGGANGPSYQDAFNMFSFEDLGSIHSVDDFFNTSSPFFDSRNGHSIDDFFNMHGFGFGGGVEEDPIVNEREKISSTSCMSHSASYTMVRFVN